MLQTHNTRTEDAQHDKRRYPTGQRRLSVERHPYTDKILKDKILEDQIIRIMLQGQDSNH